VIRQPHAPNIAIASDHPAPRHQPRIAKSIATGNARCRTWYNRLGTVVRTKCVASAPSVGSG
jgi:hypothetical protein